MAQPLPHSSAPYDYIVIGAGTAGCLLANRLSADPAKRVLLVEAGGNDDYRSAICTASATRAPTGSTAPSPMPA